MGSPLSHNALTYTWQQLAQRTGVTGDDSSGTGFEDIGVPAYYARSDRVQVDQPGIIVVPCSDAVWWALLERAPHSLDWLPANEVVPTGAQLPFDEPVPVLFWGEGYEDGNRSFAEWREDGSVIFHADIVAATFFMLSRWEETVVPMRDKHCRFPATASAAYKQGFLDRPVVDEYALILREWLKELLPQWSPNPRQFSVKLSHDVDFVRRSRNLYGAVLTLGADLLKRWSLKLVWQTMVDVFRQRVAPETTSRFQGIHFLSELSSTYGMDSAFYFMAAKPRFRGNDNDYDLTLPWMRRCMEGLRQQGFEVGFHASYHTPNDPQRLAAEKARLDAILGETKYGGRQHYLRFQVPDTWRLWEQVGLTYDSTMTYADHEGFRCGTCHPFRPFDIEQNRELDLWEWPLIVMDDTLCVYRKLTPEQGEDRILELARRCKQVGGTFTLLWHNSSLDGEWHPWAEVYRRVVGALAEMQK